MVNLHHQRKHWPHRGVKMETLTSFAVQMEARDTFMPWDIKSGYRQLRLHSDMRDFFQFQYSGGFYRCVALPFGWGPSALWFTKLMRPVVQFIRDRWCWRVLLYVDDLLLVLSPPGWPSTAANFAIDRVRLDRLCRQLGLTRHPTEVCWDGSQRLDHLGVHMDTVAMRAYVSDSNLRRVRALAGAVLLVAQKNRRLVPLPLLRQFCGVCASLTLALPLARFYTLSVYFDMASAERKEREKSPRVARRASEASPRHTQRVRLSRQSLRNLAF